MLIWKKREAFLPWIGIVISLLLVITAFEWKFYDDLGIVDLGTIKDDFEEILEIPLTKQPPPPPPIIIQPEIIEVPDGEIIEELNVELDIDVTEDDIIKIIRWNGRDVPEGRTRRNKRKWFGMQSTHLNHRNGK